MTLTQEYKRQFEWRDWVTALDLCPIQSGQRILDLGCGPGDIAQELVKRGAQVVGIDSNPDLLLEARKLQLKNCLFLNQDLRHLELEEKSFDGIWCSFAAAYFIDFESVLKRWMPFLKDKAWLCITEVDDLLGHVPLPGFSHKIEMFYQQAYLAGRYDFRSGHKIGQVLQKCGFEVQQKLLHDQELAFEGPASPEIVLAWTKRLDRMGGLRNFLGNDYQEFKTTFLESLADTNHHSSCRVFCVLGTR